MSFSLLIPCKLPALCIRDTHSLFIRYIVVAHYATYLAFFLLWWNYGTYPKWFLDDQTVTSLCHTIRSNYLLVGDSQSYVYKYEIQQSQVEGLISTYNWKGHFNLNKKCSGSTSVLTQKFLIDILPLKTV